MQIFNQIGQLIIDNSKPTVACIDIGNLNEYNHSSGFLDIIIKELKNEYNLIFFETKKTQNNNIFVSNSASFGKKLLRQKDDPNYIVKNQNVISESFDKILSVIPNIDYCITNSIQIRLPQMAYGKKNNNPQYTHLNEFFDYIGTNSETLSQIKYINKHIYDNLEKTISPIAFSTNTYYYFYKLIDAINKKFTLKKLSMFVIDPASYYSFFDTAKIKSNIFYFTNDNMGTRCFKKFPIAQLQHVVYDKQYITFKNIDKTKNLIFAGSIFINLGVRTEKWEKYLKDIKSDHCDYFIPIRINGVASNNKRENIDKEKVKQSKFSELSEEILKHNNYKGSLLPIQASKKVLSYKYGLIISCVSIHPSLNFRPVLYSYHNVLPLIDPDYDPYFLYLPKDIQKNIIVNSSNDIDEKIEYFNNNESERLEIISNLRKLFEIDNWIHYSNGMVKKEVSKIFI